MCTYAACCKSFICLNPLTAVMSVLNVSRNIVNLLFFVLTVLKLIAPEFYNVIVAAFRHEQNPYTIIFVQIVW